MFDKKNDLKDSAVKLRKRGYSYSEIKREVPVSKSTLSLWLRDTKLTKIQKQRLVNKMKANQHIGAEANKRIRIEKLEKLKNEGRNEIRKISQKELFYIGTALYWAEGSKQKDHNPSQRVTFNNSDPAMIKTYIKWLRECLQVSDENIDFEIYSHSNIRDREEDVVKYWSGIARFPKSEFKKIYYKKDKKRKYRRNKGKNYFGLLRVSVKKSTDLNRKISGWIEGICEQCGVV